MIINIMDRHSRIKDSIRNILLSVKDEKQHIETQLAHNSLQIQKELKEYERLVTTASFRTSSMTSPPCLSPKSSLSGKWSRPSRKWGATHIKFWDRK